MVVEVSKSGVSCRVGIWKDVASGDANNTTILRNSLEVSYKTLHRYLAYEQKFHF